MYDCPICLEKINIKLCYKHRKYKKKNAHINNCSMCSQETHKRIINLCCKHQIHKKCYNQMISNNYNKCPLCNKLIYAPEHHGWFGSVIDDLMKYKAGDRCIIILFDVSCIFTMIFVAIQLIYKLAYYTLNILSNCDHNNC